MPDKDKNLYSEEEAALLDLEIKQLLKSLKKQNKLLAEKINEISDRSKTNKKK